MGQVDGVHEMVRTGYGNVASRGGSCCGPASTEHAKHAKELGYDEDAIGVGGDANLGLGCGNPVALAALSEGETVVDLGSGAGFDALVAAKKLGDSGRFIGVDTTPEMLERARKNAVQAGLARNVEFREGLIEDLPVASGSADVVISNCVINLSPDKAAVFREAFRVLKPGGRLSVTDIVLSEPLPEDVAALAEGWIACVSGALTEQEYIGHIRAAGFTDVRWTKRPVDGLLDAASSDPMVAAALEAVGKERTASIVRTVYSYSIEAKKT